MTRQIVLDTETTGLEPEQGHRIIEIGCVELRNRQLSGNDLHLYINPEREIDEGALEVHGIDRDFLADKPLFSDIRQPLLDYLGDAELIIHNAPFDLGFLDHELRLIDPGFTGLAERCPITDTLVMARQMHPGQRNNLDALCRRYEVDNSKRELHGALLDAQILADVYLRMTGGQKSLQFDGEENPQQGQQRATKKVAKRYRNLKQVRPSGAELEAHQAYLDLLQDKAEDGCAWPSNTA